jgi:DNA-binding beta-propeller fold protein YncE
MKKVMLMMISLMLIIPAGIIFMPGNKVQAASSFGITNIGKQSPNGVFVGPTWITAEGLRLYVVDSLNHRVQAVMKGGKPQFSFGLYGNNEHHMTESGGISAFKERIYWLDRSQGKILVKSNKAEVIEFEEEFPITDLNGNPILKHANGIWVDNGKIYIANTGLGNIIVTDLHGKYLSTIGAYGSEPGQMLEPEGVCVTAGKLYVTDPLASRIHIYGLDGTYEKSFGSGNYFGITNLDSRLVVTDCIANKVVIFSSDGNQISSFGEPGSKPGQLSRPMGVAILEDKIHVSSYDNNRVEMFDQSGKYLGVFGLDSKDAMGSFGSPMSISITGEKLIVADATRHKIIIYNRNNSTGSFDQYDSEFGVYGTGDKELNRPSGVAADETNIYVADTGNNCVKVFAYDGAYKKTIGSLGNGQGKLNKPSDVAVIPSLNKLLVSDTGNNLIQEFSLSGEFTRQYGGFGSAAGKLNNPLGIATDGSKIIVADSANCRIQMFNVKDGSYVRQMGYRGKGPGMLYFPSDVAFDSVGRVYVADTYNDSIVVFDNSSKRVWDFGKTGGPLRCLFFTKSGEENEDLTDEDRINAYGFYTLPQGIACSSNQVFVADTGNSRVQSVPFTTIYKFPRLDEEVFASTFNGKKRPNPTVWFTVAPKILDFGVMAVGTSLEKRIEIRNWTGGVLSGTATVESNTPFMTVDPKNFVGDVINLTVKVDSTGMTAGVGVEGIIVITTNKGEEKKIPVKVLPTDQGGFAISSSTPLFCKLGCNEAATTEIIIDQQNNFDRPVSLNYSKPQRFCVLPEGLEVANLDCKGFELNGVNFEFKPGTVKLSDDNKSELRFQPKSGTLIIPGVYEIEVIVKSPSAANKDLVFSIVLLVDPCNVPGSPIQNLSKNEVADKLVPQTLLTETFTAVWCQYCPYHREAQYRAWEEYGPRHILPIAYYADADSDNSGMTQPEHHCRYRWYTKEGLPTTVYNGTWNFSEGDGPHERLKPPGDRLPNRKMSGTTFSYWRFIHRVENFRHYTTPVHMFLQGKAISPKEGTAEVEITVLQDLSTTYKDSHIYFALVENNVIYPATNGEEEHSLTVMKMLHDKDEEISEDKGCLGEPEILNLAEGSIIRKKINFKWPWVGRSPYEWQTLLKHCLIVAWIQDNTKKNVLQTTYIDLGQPLVNRFLLSKADNKNGSVQAGSRADFRYNLTNIGNYKGTYKFNFAHIDGVKWDYQILVDQVPQSLDNPIVLDPMKSSQIEFRINVPPDTAENTESRFHLNVVDLDSGEYSSQRLNLLVEPAKPPSFELTNFPQSIEVAPAGEESFNVTVNPINEYNNPVSLELSPESAKNFTATFDPPNGIPPFECKITVKANDNIEYLEQGYKLTFVAKGSDLRGEKIEKTFDIKAKAKTLRLWLKPERKMITSCATNTICQQTEVKVMISGEIPVKEARFDIVYNDKYLEYTMITKGDFFQKSGGSPSFETVIKPGRISVTAKRDDKAVTADDDDNICSITIKASGDKLEIEDVRLALENVQLFGDRGNRILVLTEDTSLSVRKNALPPVIHLFTPIKQDSPWPTPAEQERRGKLRYYVDQKVKQDSIEVSGKCESAEGISQLRLTIGTETVRLSGDGSFSFTYPLREGPNNIIIIAQNFTGETSGINVIIARDTTPPDLYIDQPQIISLEGSLKDEIATGDRTITFHGYTDKGSKLTINDNKISVQEDVNAPLEDYTRWFFRTDINLKEGLNKVEIVSCDELDNCRSYTFNVTYDPKLKGGETVEPKTILLWLNQTTMMVNDTKVILKTAPTTSSPPLPADLKGNTYMPIQPFADALGATVAWENATKKVTINHTMPDGSKRVIELWIGKKIAKINGVDTKIDDKGKLYPAIVASKTMLPLRFVATAMGAKVEYVAAERKIILTYPAP